MASPESRNGVLDVVYPGLVLTPKENRVYTLSSGWDGVDRSRREVSRMTGLSTRAIGNIEKRVLRKAEIAPRGPRV